MKRNRTATATTLFLLLTFAVSLAVIPAANAQTTKKTYAFMGIAPNPIGIGQQAALHIGIPDALQTATDGWNLTVTVTKPDAKTETLGPYMTDSTGGTGVAYIPSQVGTYYFQTVFPEQSYRNIIYLASTSDKIALNVTDEPVEYYPAAPLPTEYWTRPINAQLREWTTISGNWFVATPILPADNLYAPYNDDAPESAHVLWARPMGDTIGGLAGGVDDTGYGIGDAYEGKWGGACIIGGVLFYNKFESGQAQQQVVAVNLHTGKELWTKTLFNNLRLSFGQVLRWKSMNYQGDFSYLWATSGTNWYAFEPLTGEWRYNMTSVPSGSNYYGPKGEILRYTVNIARGWMTQWNTTSVVVKGNTGMGVAWGSQVRGKEFNATTKGYDWNVTIPTSLPGNVRTVAPLDRVIGAEITTTKVTLWALSLKPGQEGTLLYNTVWQPPSDWYSGNETISWAAASLTENVAVLYSKERTNYYAFSLSTGQFLWGPTASEHYLNIYDRISTINYGRLISSGCSGMVNCYNATTGEVLWSYTAQDPYTESLTGNTWWLQQMFVTDGKVYLGHVEHSPNQPLPRGAPFICLDVETGEEVWKVSGGFRQTCWGGKAMIADSIIALQDTYDQRVYAIGKGPSTMTVTAPDAGIAFGTSVMIKGTITDASPGSLSDDLTPRFPNGVPAVSDDSMSDWMKYVYMQFPRPTEATGLEITINVLDSNGNFREIGKTTSDANGFYSFMWTPDIPGKYTVYACFAGSKSYYSSQAETAFGVDPAPPPADSGTDVTNPVVLPPFELYIAGATAAIIIAVAVVGFVLYRKRS